MGFKYSVKAFKYILLNAYYFSELKVELYPRDIRYKIAKNAQNDRVNNPFLVLRGKPSEKFLLISSKEAQEGCLV